MFILYKSNKVGVLLYCGHLYTPGVYCGKKSIFFYRIVLVWPKKFPKAFSNLNHEKKKSNNRHSSSPIIQSIIISNSSSMKNTGANINTTICNAQKHHQFNYGKSAAKLSIILLAITTHMTASTHNQISIIALGPPLLLYPKLPILHNVVKLLNQEENYAYHSL